MQNYIIVPGKHILIEEYNAYFHDISVMLLEHFDTPEYEGVLFLLGGYIHRPVSWYRQQFPGRRIIVYQLEQMVKPNVWVNPDRLIENMSGADELWEYDTLNIAYLLSYGIQPTKYQPLLYTEALNRGWDNEECDIDILFNGSPLERRQRILETMLMGLYGRVKFVWTYGILGEELDSYIRRAKVILNLHSQEPYHRQEQSRIFYALINGKAVMSETSQVNYYGPLVAEFDHGNAAEVAKVLLEGDTYKTFGRHAQEHFRTWHDVRIRDTAWMRSALM